MALQISLKWEEQHSCVSNSFQSLRQDREFFDVSLVSDDQITVNAHRVVLSASSTFFHNILRLFSMSQTANPVIYLSGISSSDLLLVLDFVYKGEISIMEERLPKFLEATKKLRISGLSTPTISSSSKSNVTPGPEISNMSTRDRTGKESPEDDNHIENIINSEYDFKMDEIADDDGSVKKEFESSKAIVTFGEKNQSHENIYDDDRLPERIVAYDFKGNTDLSLLESKVQEFSERKNGRYVCKVCGKISKDRSHIETHFDGLSFTCELCEKVFQSREAVRKHKQRHAKGGIKRPFNVYGY